MAGKGSMKCPACGMTLFGNVDACRYCNHDLTKPVAQKSGKKAKNRWSLPKPAEAPKRLGRAWNFNPQDARKWAVIIAVVLGAILVFFFVKDVIVDRSHSDKARADLCQNRCGQNRDRAISVGDLKPGPNDGWMQTCMDTCIKTGKAPAVGER